MTPDAVIADPAYALLKRYVIEDTGLCFFTDKDAELANRIARRLASAGLRNCADYLERVRQSRREMDALIADLTIGETYFFRQVAHFEAMREVIFPELLERKRDQRRLNIWSAGCATGAEPYSIALLLKRELAGLIAGWQISIVGTDINREFLRRAREASFGNWAFRECPPDIKQECFDRVGAESVLREPYRSSVSFQYHNLVKHPLPSPADNLVGFDLILCRNVMIYFSPDLVRTTVDRLYDCLDPGGWLIVGHAEPNVETFSRFDTLLREGVPLYRKAGAGGRQPVAPVRAGAPPLEPRIIELPVMPIPSPEAPRPALLRARPGQPAPAALAVEAVRRLADSGQWADAEVACRRMIEGDALDAYLHYLLALILEHTGAPGEAESSLKRAVYLDRAFLLAHYHLGMARLRAGAAAQARKSFENVVALLAGYPDDRLVEHGEGMTAGQLRDLAVMQMEVLDEAAGER